MITKENKVKFFLKVRKISTETFICLSPWLSLFVGSFFLISAKAFWVRKLFSLLPCAFFSHPSI